MKATFGASKHFEPAIEKCVDRLIREKSASWLGEVEVQTIAHDIVRRALLVAIVGDTLVDEAAELVEQDFHHVMEYFVGKYACPYHKVDVTQEDSAQLARLEAVMTLVVQRWYGLDGPSLSSDADQHCLLRVMHNGGFSELHMARMMVNTIIAGGEAPAIALSATLEELAQLPSVQDRVATSIAKCPAGLHGVIAPHIESLEALDDTVLEGLRLFAPATLVMRVAVKDTALCGYDVPAGTVVGICITAIHHCPKVFDRALSFEPEERSGLDYVILKQRKPFLSFSAGPRGCPGKHIGTSLLRICLGKLLQQFDFMPPSQGTSSDGVRVAKFAGWKLNGIHLCASRRKLKCAL
jgi:cytochrome P450